MSCIRLEGVSAGEIASQAELMVADREERAVERGGVWVEGARKERGEVVQLKERSIVSAKRVGGNVSGEERWIDACQAFCF